MKYKFLILGLIVFIGVNFTAITVQSQGSNEFITQCIQREQLSPSEQNTITALLTVAETEHCQDAHEELSKLTRLDLSDRNLSNLKILSTLTQLQTLYLRENQIQDLTPISTLVNLKTLYLDDNQIQDLTPISTLRSLNTLYANNNKIDSLKPLGNLPHLTELYLRQNQIQNLQPLQSLSQLESLHLGNNRITKPESLADLTTLIQLSLNGNKLTKVESLNSLINLTRLDLRENPIQRKICPVLPATLCEFTDDAASLNVQGKQQIEQGEFTAALETFKAALGVYQKASDRLRESDTFNQIGYLYDELGQYANALDSYQKAREIQTEIKDRQGESNTLTHLGITAIRIGQTEKAIDSLEKAREIHQSLREEEQQFSRYQTLEGTILSGLALAYQKSGKQPKKALQFAKQSLAHYRQHGNNRQEEATALNRVGEGYLEVGNLEKARLYLEKALNLTQQEGDRTGIARSRHNLGTLARRLGDSSTALAQYQQAQQLRQDINDIAGEGESFNAIGELLLQLGQQKEAVNALQATVQLWESLRPGLTDENKISIADIQTNTYHLLQQALVSLGETEAALEVSEQGRARAFAELLAYRLSLRGETAPPEQVQPPTITEIQEIAQGQNATLVEYSLVGKELYIWVIDPTGTIHFRRQSLDEKPLETWVADQRQALGLRGRNRNPATIVVVENPNNSPGYQTLQQSYQLLIQPIADFLPTDAHTPVIIIPQGVLFLVPFAALTDENGINLLEKHPLLYAPAISLLGATSSNLDPLEIGKDPALVVGNPIMPNDPETGDPLEQLSGAELEALEIAPLLNTQPLIGADATKAAVMAKINNVAIAHFATHGLLDDLETGVPGLLALTPTATDRGFLTAADIFELPLKAQLVVLSACDTGRGNITGDGVVGLSRSFLTAGVETVIVSLWSVPDEPTRILMTEFYHQLQQHSNRAIALRQAMLTTRQRYPRQSNWAAFAVFGQTGQ